MMMLMQNMRRIRPLILVTCGLVLVFSALAYIHTMRGATLGVLPLQTVKGTQNKNDNLEIQKTKEDLEAEVEQGTSDDLVDERVIQEMGHQQKEREEQEALEKQRKEEREKAKIKQKYEEEREQKEGNDEKEEVEPANGPFDLADNRVIYVTHGTEGTPLTSGTDLNFEVCNNLEPWMKCAFTKDKTKSHAVVFRASQLTGPEKIPSYRPALQKWVFYEEFFPENTWRKANAELGIWTQFNFTSTFTLDANLSYSKQIYECRPTPDWNASNINYAEGKKTSVVWLSDKCNTDSKREKYVAELEKEIPVIKFGTCGTPHKCKNDEKCLTKLISQHKFYLAFEDHLCDGYYNDDNMLWTIRDMPIVPIVLGVSNYSTGRVNLVPPNSFIDVRNYTTPKALANFLRYLNHNNTEYNLMVDRKMHAEYTKPDTDPYHCALCRYLHLHKRHTQVYPDVREFWDAQTRCQSPKVFYSHTAPHLAQSL